MKIRTSTLNYRGFGVNPRLDISAIGGANWGRGLIAAVLRRSLIINRHRQVDTYNNTARMIGIARWRITTVAIEGGLFRSGLRCCVSSCWCWIRVWLLGGVADLKLVATLPAAQAGGHLEGEDCWCWWWRARSTFFPTISWSTHTAAPSGGSGSSGVSWRSAQPRSTIGVSGTQDLM